MIEPGVEAPQLWHPELVGSRFPVRTPADSGVRGGGNASPDRPGAAAHPEAGPGLSASGGSTPHSASNAAPYACSEGVAYPTTRPS